MNDSLELLKELIRCKPVSDRIDNVNQAESVMRNYLESKGLYCVTEQIDGRSVLYASTVPGKVKRRTSLCPRQRGLSRKCRLHCGNSLPLCGQGECFGLFHRR